MTGQSDPPTTDERVPELSLDTPDGRFYADPYPWCSLLGRLGVAEADWQPGERRFVSATNLLSNLPAKHLPGWYARQAAAAAWEAWPAFGPIGWGAGFRSHVAAEPLRVRDGAGARGTAVHDLAERDIVATDGEVELPEPAPLRSALLAMLAGEAVPDLPPDALPYCQALAAFMDDYAQSKVVWVEVTVFSLRFDAAATLDLLMWIPGRGLTLVEIKTSAYVQPKFRLQMALQQCADYAVIDGRREEVPPIDHTAVLHLRNDGTYQMVPVDADCQALTPVILALQTIRAFEAAPFPRPTWEPPSSWGLAGEVPSGRRLAFLTQVDMTTAVIDARRAQQADNHPTFEQARQSLAERVAAWPAQMVESLSARLGAVMAGARKGAPEYQAAEAYFNQWFPTTGLPALPQMDAPMLAWFEDRLDEVEAHYGLGFAGGLRPFYPLDMYFTAEEILEEAGGPTLATLHPAVVPEIIDQVARRLGIATAPMAPLGRLMLDDDGSTTELVPARRGRSVGVGIERRPAPELVERAQALIERIKALPADAIERLDAKAHEARWPHLKTWSYTADQLDTVTGWVDEESAVVDKRLAEMRAIPQYTEDNRTDAVLDALGADDITKLTAEQAELCPLVMAALAANYVKAEWIRDSDAPGMKLTSNVMESAALTKWGKATNAKAHARLAAMRWPSLANRLHVGRSLAEVMANPLLAAWVLASPAAYKSPTDEKLSPVEQEIVSAPEPVPLAEDDFDPFAATWPVESMSTSTNGHAVKDELPSMFEELAGALGRPDPVKEELAAVLVDAVKQSNAQPEPAPAGEPPPESVVDTSTGEILPTFDLCDELNARISAAIGGAIEVARPGSSRRWDVLYESDEEDGTHALWALVADGVALVAGCPPLDRSGVYVARVGPNWKPGEAVDSYVGGEVLWTVDFPAPTTVVEVARAAALGERDNRVLAYAMPADDALDVTPSGA